MEKYTWTNSVKWVFLKLVAMETNEFWMVANRYAIQVLPFGASSCMPNIRTIGKKLQILCKNLCFWTNFSSFMVGCHGNLAISEILPLIDLKVSKPKTSGHVLKPHIGFSRKYSGSIFGPWLLDYYIQAQKTALFFLEFVQIICVFYFLNLNNLSTNYNRSSSSNNNNKTTYRKTKNSK